MSTHNMENWQGDSNEYPQQAILISTHNMENWQGDSNEYPQHGDLARQF